MAEETVPVEIKEATPAPAVESQSALGPEVKSEPVVAAPVETVKAEEALIETTKPVEEKTEEKPVEVAKPAEVKAEEKPVEEKTEDPVEVKPAELPKFEPLALPEGMKLEDKTLGEIDSMFGNFEIASKASHAEIQKLRQGMVEYGLGVIKDAIATSQKQAQDYWDVKTKEYRKAFEQDPEIGGKRKEETTEAARQFIAQHAGTAEQANAVRKLLFEHKLADHPDIIRLLANANLARREAQPLPAQNAVPQKMGKLDRWYGSMKE